ncbi:MAG: hypothetical protein ACREPA_02440 [Candidatus Dormibacteraceae bacterium]
MADAPEVAEKVLRHAGGRAVMPAKVTMDLAGFGPDGRHARSQ